MHKNAALINRGRIGHLIGHLIGLGTAHEFLRERIRGVCTYAVITLVPRYTCYMGGREGGRVVVAVRRGTECQLRLVFFLSSISSPPCLSLSFSLPPPPFIFLLRRGNLAVFPSRFAFSTLSRIFYRLWW